MIEVKEDALALDRVFGRSVVTDVETLRARFISDEDLPDFAVISDFLAPDVLDAIQSFACRAPLEPFCVFSRTPQVTELETEFGVPNEDNYYVSCHRRLRPPSRVPKDIDALLGSEEVLRFLGKLTGLELTSYGDPSTLTGWNPSDFLREHCDYGTPERPTKLIVSISLTSGWSRAFGGETHFKWLGGTEEVVTWPESNLAVLFRAGHHSFHWVAQIAQSAPAGRRFTWTLHYY